MLSSDHMVIENVDRWMWTVDSSVQVKTFGYIVITLFYLLLLCDSCTMQKSSDNLHTNY